MTATGCTSDRSFGRARRLTSGSQFRRVFDQARRSSDRLFTVLACANEEGRARLGMAVAKKRIRRASSRNRIKRLVRESFRHHAAGLAALDLVVISRSDGSASNRDICTSLARHWARLNR
jgi:ribonuclease P protein component